MAIRALKKSRISKILFAHSPEMAVEAAQASYHLYLTGHTHGGQIALPGGRPILTRLSKCKNLVLANEKLKE
jgi:predicted MPP superfamily phosphohydrolase